MTASRYRFATRLMRAAAALLNVAAELEELADEAQVLGFGTGALRKAATAARNVAFELIGGAQC